MRSGMVIVVVGYGDWFVVRKVVMCRLFRDRQIDVINATQSSPFSS
jgi:hypothetical protein